MSYEASDIQIYNDIDHVRLRKGMYIGESYNPNQLYNEIFDNSIDEDMSGFSRSPMIITIDKDNNLYSIRDFGRGLPQGNKVLEDGTSKSVINIIFTELKSGGKFGGESYKISGGLHGMGDCIVNALSENLTVKSFREKVEIHKFEFGQEVFFDVQENEFEEFGTLVIFKPDKEMFETDIISVDYILNRCKIASSFGYHSILRVIENNEISEISTKSDVKELISEDENINDFIYFEDNVLMESGESMKYYIWYTNDTSCKNRAYTNLLPNSQGGTHVNIFCNAFEDAWSKLKVSDIIPKDLYLGLRFVVSAFLIETEFGGQTKDKLTVKKKQLEHFIEPLSESIYQNLIKPENKDIINGIIRRFQEHRASQNKLLAKKEIKDLIVINKDNSGTVRRKSVVSKLKECTSKSREDTEIHITEGDSAADPLVTMRDLLTQAILPIRGKILNVSRFLYDLVKSLNNEEVRSIVNAAGTGILDDCNPSRSRYERYIIDTDADEDGKQIQALVIAIFINLLPNVVKNGMLYVSVPPLYGWYEKNEFKTSNNMNDIPAKTHFERFKGLGQMNPNEIYDVLLNKETRTLMRVDYPDSVDYFNEILTSSSAKYDILYELGIIKYVD